jgi:hypothetical protein
LLLFQLAFNVCNHGFAPRLNLILSDEEVFTALISGRGKVFEASLVLQLALLFGTGKLERANDDLRLLERI